MISVCLATYNGAKYIRLQLESILTQLSLDDEIVISDDGSKDDTIQIISDLNDSRIRVFLNSAPHGVVPNFKNALCQAKGDYIFFCDQDDVWAPNKVKICVEELQHSDLVVHNALLMDGDGHISNVDFFSLRGSRPGYWHNLYKNSFIGCCMAFRREVLDYVMPFPAHILWHDMWLGLMVEKHGKTKFINDNLLYYRRHGDNASATAEKSTFSLAFQLKYRLQMLYYSLKN
jgi:glycosyltransferase involved in cell wall biosynthesis